MSQSLRESSVPPSQQKAAVTEAVETSERDEVMQEVLTEAVRIASPGAKWAAIAEALWSLPLQAKN